MRPERYTLIALLLVLGLSASATTNGSRHQRADARASKATRSVTRDAQALNDADVFRYHYNNPKRG